MRRLLLILSLLLLVNVTGHARDFDYTSCTVGDGTCQAGDPWAASDANELRATLNANNIYYTADYAATGTTGGLQEAITAACADGSEQGATVELSGDITATSTVTIPNTCDHLVLQGGGMGNLWTFPGGSTGLVVAADWVVLRNFKIRPTTLDAGSIAIDLTDGVAAGAAPNSFHLEDLWVIGGGTEVTGLGTGVRGQGAIKGMISGGQYSGWGTGIYFTDNVAGDVDPNANEIAGVVFRNNAVNGLHVDELTSTISITGATFENNTTGIRCDGTPDGGIIVSKGIHMENITTNWHREAANCGIVSIGDREGAAAVGFRRNLPSGGTRDVFIGTYFASTDPLENAAAQCTFVMYPSNTGNLDVANENICGFENDGTDGTMGWGPFNFNSATMRVPTEADCSDNTADAEICVDTTGVLYIEGIALDISNALDLTASGQITALTDISSTASDWVLVEASADGALHREQIGSFVVTDTNAVHLNNAGEFANAQGGQELAPQAGDRLLMEDASQANIKKWVTLGDLPGGGGGGSPGGATGDVQYNDGASGFSGEAEFNYDPVNNRLSVGEVDIPSVDNSNGITLKNNSTDLTNTPAEGASIYTKSDGEVYKKDPGDSVRGHRFLTDQGTAGDGSGQLADCDDAVTDKVLYDSTTGLLSCGVDQTGAGGGDVVAIGSGTQAVNIPSLAAGACDTSVTTAAAGVATTDVVKFTPAARISQQVGWGTTDAIRLDVYVSAAGVITWEGCNPTPNTVDAASVSFNWRVDR
jgi:hypothetical protein